MTVGNLSGSKSPGTRSVSKNFTLAFIGVVSLLLVGFAAVVIVIDNRKLVVSRESVHQAILSKVAGSLALIAVIIAAISATSMVITRRYVARPLAALQRSAGSIARGDLDAPIDTTQQDEIGHLARDLNAMRGSLKALIEERRQNEGRLENANRTLEQKVEARTEELLREIGGVLLASVAGRRGEKIEEEKG